MSLCTCEPKSIGSVPCPMHWTDSEWLEYKFAQAEISRLADGRKDICNGSATNTSDFGVNRLDDMDVS